MLFLAFKSIAKGQVSIDVVFAMLYTFLEMRDSLGVLAANVVKDACVVEHDRVRMVQIEGTLIII